MCNFLFNAVFKNFESVFRQARYAEAVSSFDRDGNPHQRSFDLNYVVLARLYLAGNGNLSKQEQQNR